MNRAIKFYKENPQKFHELYERRKEKIIFMLKIWQCDFLIGGIEVAALIPPAPLSGETKPVIFIKFLSGHIVGDYYQEQNYEIPNLCFNIEKNELCRKHASTLDILLIFHHLKQVTVLDCFHRRQFKGFKQTELDVWWPNFDYFFVDYGIDRPLLPIRWLN